nr:hypothetical protein [Rhodococcus sp. (in: high G+C Gram-positive bacteria)]
MDDGSFLRVREDFVKHRPSRTLLVRPHIPIEVLTVRLSRGSRGAHVALDALGSLGGLIFRIDRVFEQGTPVTCVDWVIETPVSGDPNAYLTLGAQLDKLHPLPNPSGATGRLPESEDVGVEGVGFKVGDQAYEILAFPLGIPRSAAVCVPVRRSRVELPTLTLDSTDVLVMLLIRAFTCSGAVFRDTKIFANVQRFTHT